MAVVCHAVNLFDENYNLVTLLPGDTIPEWALDRITNPELLGVEPPKVPEVSRGPEDDPEGPVDYLALKKDELVKLATERGVDSSGNKPDIAARLAEADTAAEVDVFAMSLDELRVLAAERGVDVSAATTDIEAATILQSAE